MSNLLTSWRQWLAPMYDDLDPLDIETEQERKSSMIRLFMRGFTVISLLTAVMLWGLVIMGLDGLTDVLDHPAVPLFVGGGVAALTPVALLTIFFNNRGYVDYASYTLVYGLNCIALGAYIYIDFWVDNFGMGASAMPFLTLTILLSGLLVSARTTLILGCVNSMVMLIVVAVMEEGRARQGLVATINDWWMMALIAWVYARTLDQTLARLRAARRHLEKLVASRTQELQAKNLQLEQEVETRKRAEEAAEKASRAKSTFLANMSHELRTPLNAILGFTQLMERDPHMPPDQQENVAIINRSGTHLLELINDVLEMSKIEAGRNTLNIAPFDLHTTLHSLEALFRSRAETSGLSLLADYAPDLPRYVAGDERKLRQILLNLLSNAVKFTSEGGISLRVAYHAPYLHCEVEDTGQGIAEEELPRLFEAFIQTSSGQTQVDGTGLGLPISRQFVELMGGALKVHSTPGKGSVFSFTVQLAVVEQPPQLDPSPRRVIGLAAGQPIYRILVVEDKTENRLLLRKILLPLGFDVREAVNGQEAVTLHEQWQPHLIFMDIRMPVMDGYEATRRIKATGQPTIIIALTASVFEESRREILAAGCDDFMGKPFRESDLFDRLHQHLGVAFIYETSPVPETDMALTPVQLAPLPADWRMALHKVAMSANARQTMQLIEQIKPQYPTLAAQLADLVHNFRFDILMDITQPAN